MVNVNARPLLVGETGRRYAPRFMPQSSSFLGRRVILAVLGAVIACQFAARSALAQSVASLTDDQIQQLVDRPLSAVTFEGLQRVSPAEVTNNIRTAVGDPFNVRTILDDVARLTRLGQFKYVDAVAALQNDGSVRLRYEFEEQSMIRQRQVVGNKLLSDQDLLAVVQVVPEGPRDDFLIQTAKRRIETLYKKRGHYLTTVSIDEAELDSSGLLIFKIIEGPRVKVKAVEFEGNQAYTDDQVIAEVKTRTALFLFRKGELDEEILADDVAALDRFYKDRGYLDVRVDRQIELSPDNKEAKVVFLLAEGDSYTLRTVQVSDLQGKPIKVFAPEQVAAILELKSGDVYSRDLLRKSTQALQEAYGRLGYLDTRIDDYVLRVGDQPKVDLLLELEEGAQFKVDTLQINGNFLTRDKVIRRELRGLSPGRPFDAVEIAKSEDRLTRTRLFNDARVTVQEEDPDNPGYRGVLVEVKERNTGSFNFGVAAGSDSGLFGEFSLSQNNFDIADWPESLDEAITGRAFRGGGQKFNMTIRPGTELFQFLVSLTEPHLMDTDYALTVSAQYRDRFYDQYDEQRAGGSFRLARAFGDVWVAGIQGRAEQISLDNIEEDAPTEIFLDAGPDFITSLGVNLTRTTIDSARRPGSGSRFEFAFDRYGALGGDFDFNVVTAEYTLYLTLDEDFLGRLTTLRLNSRVGHIFGGGRAPTYEQFYMGGRTMRGFDFRTISPKGIRNDNGDPSEEPVGGEWMFFAGAQFERPLFADVFTFVLFVDSGTVSDDVNFDQYRVSVGAGIRLYIEQFGELPLAFDFAIPVVSEETDEEQVFSFSAELPF